MEEEEERPKKFNNGRKDYSKLTKEELIRSIYELESKLSSSGLNPTPSSELSFNPDLSDQEPSIIRAEKEKGAPKDSLTEISSSSGQEVKKIDPKPSNDQGKVDSKPSNKKMRPNKKVFNFRKFCTRKIALKVCYTGYEHGGFAYQPEKTRLTTVESELFRAFLISRLVETSKEFDESRCYEDDNETWKDEVDLQGWGYSRAGRTDAGVSGSGQVVSLWVRSALNEGNKDRSLDSLHGFRKPIEPTEREIDEVNNSNESSSSSSGELDYDSILNSILPPSVRVIAWSGVSEDFDARFSCLSRHYKYFFSLYESNHMKKPLDIDSMREAARKLIGEHDFRNLCRLDPSKQINNFNRKIISAEISPVSTALMRKDFTSDGGGREDLGCGLGGSEASDDRGNPMFVFDLVGTAFLYNMVRHIVAILFLIGSDLESPSLIDRLLYTDPETQPRPEPALIADGSEIEPIDRKPQYNFASSLPLILYRCNYREGSFHWNSKPSNSSSSSSNSTNDLFLKWSRDRIKTMISYTHLRSSSSSKILSSDSFNPSLLSSALTLNQKTQIRSYDDDGRELNKKKNSSSSEERPVELLGGGEFRFFKNYLKVLDRDRLSHFDEANQKWMNRIGNKRKERKRLKELRREEEE